MFEGIACMVTQNLVSVSTDLLYPVVTFCRSLLLYHTMDSQCSLYNRNGVISTFKSNQIKESIPHTAEPIQKIHPSYFVPQEPLLVSKAVLMRILQEAEPMERVGKSWLYGERGKKRKIYFMQLVRAIVGLVSPKSAG